VLDEPAWQKPPLGHWLAAASMSVLGPTPFAASLPSVLAGALLLALLFLVVDRLAGPLAGVVSALALLFTPGFVRTTATLRFESLLQLLGLLALVAVERGRTRPWAFALAWALLGAAVLAKSVVGLVPLAVLALTALATRRAFPFDRRAFWASAPAVLLVPAPWYLWTTLRHGAEFWRAHLGVEVGERMTGGGDVAGVLDALASSARFVGPALLVLAPLGAAAAWRALRRDEARFRFVVLGLAWIAFVTAGQLVNRMPFARYLYYALVPLAAFAGASVLWVRARLPERAPHLVAGAALLLALGVRVAPPAPRERDVALREILARVSAEPASPPLLVVAKDHDQAETFVWFHAHRSTRWLPVATYRDARAADPALAGRLALLDDRAFETLEAGKDHDLVRDGRPFQLVRLR
jgi:4-amino-4-deoxy-L-arabinose transferase-like glycosyltransferase